MMQSERSIPLQPTLPARPPLWKRWPFIAGTALAALVVIACLVILVWPKSKMPPSISSNCTPNAILVNPCRPWFGATVSGEPGVGSGIASQFDYLQNLIGQHIDIYRSYHSPPGSGKSNAELPLNAQERYFVSQPNTYLDINWKPADTWAQADGSDSSINQEIAQTADNIKSAAPHKVFLTIWWEGQLDVDPPNCSGRTAGTAGTPAQYIAMWQNVENIFKQQGVTNVVWVMNYSGAPSVECLVPQIWPGNNLVDWVVYDSYDHDNSSGTTWGNTVGRFYNVLQQDNSAMTDFESKPWGLGEFGTCKNKNASNTEQYFLDGASSISANTYPNLKMYIIFDNTGNNSGPACLTNRNINGALNNTKQADFDRLVHSIFTR